MMTILLIIAYLVLISRIAMMKIADVLNALETHEAELNEYGFF